VRPRLALIASAGDERDALRTYLAGAGFDVHICERLAVPTAFASLVLIGDAASSEAAIARTVRSWIKLARSARIVVVTFKPTALRGIASAYSRRLAVLAAPAFAWDVVDALRATDPTDPSNA